MKDLYFIYPYLFRVYQLKQLKHILDTTLYITKRPLNKMNKEIQLVEESIKQLNIENIDHQFHLNNNEVLDKYAKIIGTRFANLIYDEILLKLR